MIRIIIICICIGLSKLIPIQAQNNHSFKIGESVSYDIYYNWGFVWLQAAQVTFQIKEKTFEHSPVYHFDSQGGTLPNYDWIYHVKDRYQSYAETNSLNPLWALRDIHEGRTRLYNQHHFNYNDSTILSNQKVGEATSQIDTLAIKKQTFDVLSAIYKCRNLDFSNYTIGDTIPIPVVIDNEIFSLYIRYLGNEAITHKNKKVYQTIKFSVLLIEGTIFSGGEDMTVWVSNDSNRIPIHVEANILVGSIKAYIRQVSGQKDSLLTY